MMDERAYLRDLAKRQRELAELPIMRQREQMWYDHNEAKGPRPMISVEEGHYWKEMAPEMHCTDPLNREMEYQLLNQIHRVEMIGDDRVTPDFYEIKYGVYDSICGLGQKEVQGDTRASDGTAGYHIEPQIEIIEDDFEKLRPTVFRYPAEVVEKKKAAAEDIFGDILPVRLVNATNNWGPSPLRSIIGFMGMENAYISMATEPEWFHRLMDFVTEDAIRLYRWEEENGHMFLNNGNTLIGSGNWCFTRELPQPDFAGKVRSQDTWVHMNAEEACDISPTMFKELILPYQKRIAEEFGLIYYGCCEPTSKFWDDGIETIENVRKVSISPWCDEHFMGERLAGKKIIYSRKPKDYMYIGSQAAFDEEAFRKNIRETVAVTKGCKVEYIFRDVMTIHGNGAKVKRAVEIVREEAGTY